jgi:hypothetical protein
MMLGVRFLGRRHGTKSQITLAIFFRSYREARERCQNVLEGRENRENFNAPNSAFENPPHKVFETLKEMSFLPNSVTRAGTAVPAARQNKSRRNFDKSRTCSDSSRTCRKSPRRLSDKSRPLFCLTFRNTSKPA